MIDKLYDLKSDVVERLMKVIDERGLERMSADELFDAMKDLAEAEYYCSVTDAMESYGYMPDDMMGVGYDDGMGYDGRGGNRGNRGGSGNRSGYRDSMGRYSTRANRRRGYRMGHMDAIENIREELQSATAEERDQLKREVLQMFGM